MPDGDFEVAKVKQIIFNLKTIIMRKIFEKISGFLSKIEVDKWMHFDAVLFISVVAAKVLKFCGADTATAVMAGFVVGIGTGLAKEIWDKKSGESFDFADIKADVYGAVTGAVAGAI